MNTLNTYVAVSDLCVAAASLFLAGTLTAGGHYLIASALAIAALASGAAGSLGLIRSAYLNAVTIARGDR